MPQIKFTDRKIASLRSPETGQIDYFDQGMRGFGLRVSHGGSKSWFIKYVHRTKQRRLTIGPYPEIRLAKARKIALAKKNDVAMGLDPALEQRAEREAPTFLDLTESYIERHAQPKKRTWREDQRILQKYCKAWHHRKAADISRLDVVELLHRIADNGAGVMGNRVLATVRKCYNYGIKNGLVEANPAYMVDAPAPESARDRVFSEEEIVRLWRTFDALGTSGAVFKTCFATGQRLREVCRMSWAEVDLEQGTWTLPSSRTKNQLVHVVPLNDTAIDLLATQRGLDTVWVFPSPSRPGQSIDNFGRAARRVKKLAVIPDYRTHDARRTVATELTRLGFSQFVVGKLLNHKTAGVTQRHYDRYEYLKEKTQASEAWSRRLNDILGATEKVVQLVPPAS